MNEFDFIAEYLSGLAGPQGLGFQDDAACWTPSTGQDAVITMDTLCEGVHFPHGQFDSRLAHKLIRVNISDLTAKGADPAGYFLSLGLPNGLENAALTDFCSGLAQDQAEFGISLWGGDTVKTGGPAVLTITMIGTLPSGQMVRRSGAKAGDFICVTGCIGDAYLGLAGEKDALELGFDALNALRRAYYIPKPPFALRRAIRAYAHAALDISDGLIADAGHIASASNVKLELEFGKIPVSSAAKSWLSQQADKDKGMVELVTGGDDYQALLCVPPESFEAIAESAKKNAVKLTRIGTVKSGAGIACLGQNGEPLTISKTGYTHF